MLVCVLIFPVPAINSSMRFILSGSGKICSPEFGHVSSVMDDDGVSLLFFFGKAFDDFRRGIKLLAQGKNIGFQRLSLVLIFTLLALDIVLPRDDGRLVQRFLSDAGSAGQHAIWSQIDVEQIDPLVAQYEFANLVRMRH